MIIIYCSIILFYFKIYKNFRIWRRFTTTIFSILVIYYFMKFLRLEKFDEEKKDYFFIINLFRICFTLKLSVATINFITFFYIFKNFRDLNSIFSVINFYYLFFSSLFYCNNLFIQVVFFSNNLACFNVSWFNE